MIYEKISNDVIIKFNMFRAQLTMKKTLQSRWNDLVYNMHIERLINAKSQVNTETPARFNLSLKRQKKNVLLGSILK